jgi:hypothetical protein
MNLDLSAAGKTLTARIRVSTGVIQLAAASNAGRDQAGREGVDGDRLGQRQRASASASADGGHSPIAS